MRKLLLPFAFLAACSSSEDAVFVDSGVDGSALDSAVGDANDGGPDTGAGDTGAGDTGAGDTGTGDTGAGDTGTGDTGKGDTGTKDSAPDTKPDVGPAGCGSDGDCRAYESYCASKDPCACIALAAGEPDPECPGGTKVTCFVAPCATRRAACVGGACVLVTK